MNELDRLREQLARQEAELRLIDELGERLASARDSAQVAALLAEQVKRLLPVTTLVIFERAGEDMATLLVDSPCASRLAEAELLGLHEPLLDESWRSGKVLQSSVSAADQTRIFVGESTSAAYPLGDQGLLYLGLAPALVLAAPVSRLLAALARQAGLALLAVSRLVRLQEAVRRQEEAYRQLEQREMELVRAGKMAAVGQLAAGVAHELNTPLATISLEVEALALELEADAEAAEALDKVSRELQRAQEIVASLLYYSRDAGVGERVFELNKVIGDSVSLVDSQLRLHGLKVTLDLCEQPLEFRGNGNEVQQIVLNLLLNARDAVEGRGGEGAVTVRTGRETNSVWMEVRDNGPGVPAEVVERIFDPFFTTKPVGRGTGLGLSISRRLAERHGGTLEQRQLAGGACFVLALPRENSPAIC